MFEYDCSENNEKLSKIMKNYQKCQKMTKSLTFLNWIATKIMKNYEKY